MISKYDVFQMVVFCIYMAIFYATETIRQSLVVMLLLVFVAFILMILEYKKTHQFISPMFFWYGFWIVIIAIARVDFHVYAFNATWESELFWIIVINTITFFVVYKISEIASNIHFREPNIYSEDRSDYAEWSIILSITGIIAYILNVVYTGGIPQFSSNIDEFRRGFVETPFYSIVTICRCVFVILPLALKSQIPRKIKKRVVILGLILLMCEALSGWRTYVFQSIILAMTSFLINTDVSSYAVRIRNMRLIRRVGILAILFIGYVAVTRGQSEWDSLRQQVVYVIQIIYLYFAPAFLNLQQAIFNVEPVGKFLYTTEALWRKIISPDNMPGFQNISQTTGSFNVSTYLLQPYADMGVFGTIIWTGLIAFIAARSFKSASRNKDLLQIMILAILNVVIFNFHNGFFLRSTSVLLWIFIAWFIQRTNVKIKLYSKEVLN